MKYNLIKLFRIKQWYKNSLIFLPAFFASQIFNTNSFIPLLFGFISFCLTSSSYYIINDIYDIKYDVFHPEKNQRPIASKKISIKSAKFMSAILFIISILIALFVSRLFFVFNLALFTSTMLYMVYFRNKIIIDIYFIGLNFLIRVTAGAYIIKHIISPWTLLLIFIVALFLATIKRKYDFNIAPKKLRKKKRYYLYNEEFLNSLSLILCSAILFIYSMYAFIAHDSKLVLTIFLVGFIIFKYIYFISINHPILGKTELFFKDKSLLITFILWLFSCYVLLYLI
jgi:decaprenyl-phosphate phosphoribosyltransferase